MVEVYRHTEKYPVHERYGLAMQMRRAAGSVVSNIAEGQGRLTFGEWRQFLSQARGSLYELQAQVEASQRLGFLTESAATQLHAHIPMTGSALMGLIGWVQRQAKARKQNAPP